MLVMKLRKTLRIRLATPSQLRLAWWLWSSFTWIWCSECDPVCVWVCYCSEKCKIKCLILYFTMLFHWHLGFGVWGKERSKISQSCDTMNNVDFSGLLPARALRCFLPAWLPDLPLIVNNVNNSTKSVPVKPLTQLHRNSVWFRVADITNSSFSSGWGIPARPRASRVSPFTSPSAQKYEKKQISPRERQDTECMLCKCYLGFGNCGFRGII